MPPRGVLSEASLPPGSLGWATGQSIEGKTTLKDNFCGIRKGVIGGNPPFAGLVEGCPGTMSPWQATSGPSNVLESCGLSDSMLPGPDGLDVRKALRGFCFSLWALVA